MFIVPTHPPYLPSLLRSRFRRCNRWCPSILHCCVTCKDPPCNFYLSRFRSRNLWDRLDGKCVSRKSGNVITRITQWYNVYLLISYSTSFYTLDVNSTYVKASFIYLILSHINSFDKSISCNLKTIKIQWLYEYWCLERLWIYRLYEISLSLSNISQMYLATFRIVSMNGNRCSCALSTINWYSRLILH